MKIIVTTVLICSGLISQCGAMKLRDNPYRMTVSDDEYVPHKSVLSPMEEEDDFPEMDVDMPIDDVLHMSFEEFFDNVPPCRNMRGDLLTADRKPLTAEYVKSNRNFIVQLFKQERPVTLERIAASYKDIEKINIFVDGVALKSDTWGELIIQAPLKRVLRNAGAQE